MSRHIERRRRELAKDERALRYEGVHAGMRGNFTMGSQDPSLGAAVEHMIGGKAEKSDSRIKNLMESSCSGGVVCGVEERTNLYL